MAARQLWYLTYPGGEARKLTNDLNNYAGLSVTTNSRALVATQTEESLSLWIASGQDSNQAKQLPRVGKDDGARGIAWTPNGKIVFTCTVSGMDELWITDSDGGNQKSLEAKISYDPAVSADGHWLVFASNQRSGDAHIWTMDLSNGQVKELTSGFTAHYPSCSPDGKWVVYTYNSPGKITLWRVPLEGATAVALTDQDSRQPVISPDGKQIAYFAPREQGQYKIALIAFEGGPVIKTFDIPPTLALTAGLRWAPDGRALNYVDTRGGVSNIWSQPLDGTSPKQLTDFKAEQIRSFAWSPDGRLAFSRGVVNSDVVLITE